jgi:DNA-binding HxlR family transcriptional regulator
MFRGARTYKELLEADEGIATNTLADRLQKLEKAGIVSARQDPVDGRRLIYKLTPKGIDLAPVLVELILWASRHEATPCPRPLLHKLQHNRASFLAEIRKKWRDSA